MQMVALCGILGRYDPIDCPFRSSVRRIPLVWGLFSPICQLANRFLERGRRANFRFDVRCCKRFSTGMNRTTTRTFGPLAALALFAAGLITPAVANDDALERALELVRRSSGAFRATSAQDVAQARAEAIGKWQALGQIFDRSGANGQAWKEYLLWDRLTAALSDNATTNADELAKLLDRFHRHYAGLEHPAIMQLRDALHRYQHRLLAVKNKGLRDEFAQRMAELEQLVQSLHTAPHSETLQRIAVQLRWLRDHEQVPETVQVVRNLASAANIRVVASQSLIGRATYEPIDRVDPLTDVVLGTTVHGTSHLVGTMQAYPAASSQDVLLQARLQGDADTAGRGYNGPVRANVIGRALVEAAGEITFGPEGFRVGQTEAHVSATGRPTCMWTTCKSRIANGLITCVAKRRAARTQELGDCIASRHAEQRMEQQLDDELNDRVGKLQQSYLSEFRNPLLRHDTFPRVFQASSQADNAQVVMLLASSVQTGALTAAPESNIDAALHAQVHETAANNMAATMLAGRTISEVELRDFVSDMFGKPAEQTQVAKRDLLEIVFSDALPLSFLFDDSVITIKIRGDRFIRYRTRYPAMNMIVRYAVEQSGDAVTARRAGEPEVVPKDFEVTGPRPLSAREIGTRRLIIAMLERELAASYQLGKIALPDQFRGELTVTRLVANDGWLDIGAEPTEGGASGP